MKIQEVIGEDKYIDQLDSDINSTIIAMMANDIDEISMNDFQEQLKLDSPFFKELSDIWAKQIDKGVKKLPRFHWENNS